MPIKGRTSPNGTETEDYLEARPRTTQYGMAMIALSAEESTSVLRHDSPWPNLKKSAQTIKAIGNTNGNLGAVARANPNVKRNHANRKEPNPPTGRPSPLES